MHKNVKLKNQEHIRRKMLRFKTAAVRNREVLSTAASDYKQIGIEYTSCFVIDGQDNNAKRVLFYGVVRGIVADEPIRTSASGTSFSLDNDSPIRKILSGLTVPAIPGDTVVAAFPLFTLSKWKEFYLLQHQPVLLEEQKVDMLRLKRKTHVWYYDSPRQTGLALRTARDSTDGLAIVPGEMLEKIVDTAFEHGISVIERDFLLKACNERYEHLRKLYEGKLSPLSTALLMNCEEP